MDFHRLKSFLQTEHTLADDEWKGAVLFLCNEDHVFLIKRSEKMPTHSGQMAFVGGHKKSDETHPWSVAQREYEEETFHPRSTIEFIGFLPAVLTSRRLPIIPVVTRLLIPTEKFMQEVKSNGEWDDIIAYPWDLLMDERRWEFAWRNGYSRGPMMFHPILAKSYLPESTKTHLLWGATASMIWDFLRLYFKPDVSPY